MFPGPLRAFHEVVQAGSIRKASERMGLAPSSVSRQVIVLETMMGTSLFKRSLDGVILTHAGMMVADYARSTVMDFDALRLDLDDLKGSRGLIKIAMVESIVSGGPVRAAVAFRQMFKGVSFEFQVVPASVVVEAVLERSVDIGISFCTELTTEITNEATIPEPLRLVVRKEHALAATQTLTLHDLADTDLALPDAKFGVRRLVERTARQCGISIKPIMTSNSFEALRDFVRASDGATILPKRAVGAGSGSAELVAVELGHAEFNNTTLDVIRYKPRRLPRIMRLYLESLRNNLADFD